MLSQQTQRLECTEQGDTRVGEESNTKRPTPPAENRGAPTGETTQPHDVTTPPQLRMTGETDGGPASAEKLKGTRGRIATPGSKPSTMMTREPVQEQGSDEGQLTGREHWSKDRNRKSTIRRNRQVTWNFWNFWLQVVFPNASSVPKR